MKKLFIILALLISTVAFANDDRDLRIGEKTISSKSIAGGASYTPWTINQQTLSGSSSLQLEVSGDGTVDAQIAASNDGKSYVGAGFADGYEGTIFEGVTKTSGFGGDGIVFDYLIPPFARYVQVGFSNTAVTNTVTITATLGTR